MIEEQALSAVAEGPVDPARPLRAAPHQEPPGAITEARRTLPELPAHRVAGDLHDGPAQLPGGAGEGDGDPGGAPGQHPGGAAGDGVLLEEQDRDTLPACGQHHRHRDVARGSHHHLGSEAADQPARLAHRPRQSQPEAGQRRRAGEVEAADLQGLQRDAGALDEGLGDPAAPADQEHRPLGVSGAQLFGDRQRRGQVPPRPAPGDQRSHG